MRGELVRWSVVWALMVGVASAGCFCLPDGEKKRAGEERRAAREKRSERREQQRAKRRDAREKRRKRRLKIKPTHKKDLKGSGTDAASACVKQCMQQNAMRAVAAEQIERDCAAQCKGR